MSDNYLQFSEKLEELTSKEADWIEALIKTRSEVDEADFQYSKWTNDRNGKPIIVWFYSEVAGEPAHVAEIVQAFFKHFKKKGTWTLTFAATCSQPRVGEFYGGAVVVTAEKLYYCDSLDWALRKAEKINKSNESDVSKKKARRAV